MKKFRLPLRIYGVAIIFLVYAGLQISYGLTDLRSTNGAMKAKNKVSARKAFASPGLAYEPEFPNIIYGAFIR